MAVETITASQVEEEARRQGIDRLTPAKRQKILDGIARAWEKEEKEKYAKSPTVKDRGRMTLTEFIDGPWMTTYVKDGRKSPNSVAFFEATARHIKTFMGDTQLRKIDAELCSRFVSYLNTRAKTRGGEPLSQTSRMHIFSTLRNVLRTARRWRYIQSDPTDDMSPRERPRRPRSEVKYLTKDEVQAFATALQSEPINKRAYFMLLLATGMRRGEAVALQWSDIDDRRRVITVSKNCIVDKSQKDGRRIKSTKTGETREIPITEETLRMLQDLKAYTEDAAGKALTSTAFIFCTDGDPYTCIYPTTPTRWMTSIIKRNGLKKCTVHELRRTFATLALQARIDPKTVASITGHADTATLFTYYAGTDTDQQRKAVDEISAILTI